MDQDQKKPQTPRGYGKRPMWQRVVIYVIVGAIVYGLAYYLFFRKSGGDGGFHY